MQQGVEQFGLAAEGVADLGGLDVDWLQLVAHAVEQLAEAADVDAALGAVGVGGDRDRVPDVLAERPRVRAVGAPGPALHAAQRGASAEQVADAVVAIRRRAVDASLGGDADLVEAQAQLGGDHFAVHELAVDLDLLGAA